MKMLLPPRLELRTEYDSFDGRAQRAGITHLRTVIAQ